jgi:hypothetical protein
MDTAACGNTRRTPRGGEATRAVGLFRAYHSTLELGDQGVYGILGIESSCANRAYCADADHFAVQHLPPPEFAPNRDHRARPFRE